MVTINTRFSVAIHVLSLIETSGKRATSDYIAGSVNTNPVVVRRIMGMLNKAGLVRTRPGVAGAELNRALRDITLLDVYKAVLSDPEEELFAIHNNPNPACPVGRNIQATLEQVFEASQLAMENELGKTTMEAVVSDLQHRMQS